MGHLSPPARERMRTQDREELISENLQRERRRKGRERRQREHKGREKGRAKGQWGRRDKQRIEVKKENMEEERKQGLSAEYAEKWGGNQPLLGESE